VTRGDLSRSIQVEARGEVSYLKDNINEMIRNLKETTQKNAQQDWLKTNLARFTRLLQGQRDLEAGQRADPVGTGAAGGRASWHVLHDGCRRVAAVHDRQLRLSQDQ